MSGGSTGLDLADALDLRHCEIVGTCGFDAYFGSSLAVGTFAASGGTYEDLAIGAPGFGSEFGTWSAGAVYVWRAARTARRVSTAGPASRRRTWASGSRRTTSSATGSPSAVSTTTGKGALVASAPGEDLDATTTDIGLVHVIAPWRQVLNLACEYSVVLDCEDQIVFSQKPFDQVSIASTTKAMTVLLAAERSQLPPSDPLYVSLNEPYVVPAWVANDVQGSQVQLRRGRDDHAARADVDLHHGLGERRRLRHRGAGRTTSAFPMQRLLASSWTR